MVPKNPEKIKGRPAGLIQPGYRYLIIIFTILAFILIGAILYFALSQATVYLTPNYQEQRVGFAVQVANKANLNLKEQPTLDKLPGEILETSVEESKTYPAENYTEESTKAEGQVTIINNYSRNQTLIATTRLLSPDNKLYRLTETVQVPAGGKITATAAADQAGKTYESGPVKLSIPGLWEGIRDKIYAESEGFKQQSLIKYKITEKTVKAAQTDLENILLTKAKENLTKELAPGQIIPEQGWVKEIVKYTPPTRQAGQKDFTTSFGLGVKALIFDENQLKTLAAKNLPDFYQDDGSLVEIDPASFNYEIVFLDKNSENLIAQIKGEYTVKAAKVSIQPQELAGLSKKEALNYLQKFGDIKEASIALPFWTRYLPALADKINIQIKE